MEQEETGCQAPEGPILCVNNCGFFGSAATMNMCSKCHKDMVMKQEQAKLAASSIDSIVNAASGGAGSIISNNGKGSTGMGDIVGPSELPKSLTSDLTDIFHSVPNVEAKPKDGPSRCATCRKRVGLTGFSCRCGDLFCALHRYSDKHNCPFDYRGVARDAIAKANPIVKADKLDKI